MTHLHIAVPTKTRFYASRIHVLKTAKLLGGRNVNEYIHSRNSLGIFKENFFETIRYVGLTITEITEIVMLFQYSEILFY